MTKNNVIKIVVYVLLLLAVVAIIGIVANLTNGFTSELQTFYVSVGEENVLTSRGGYKITPSEPLVAEVQYPFDFITTEDQEYSIKIVPNTETGKDFRFTVGGEEHRFYSEEDLTEGFRITKSGTSFTIMPKGGTLTEVLQVIYPNEEVSNCDEYSYDDMFTAVITSSSGKSSIKLYFTIDSSKTGVFLDREVIVF